MFNNLLIVCIGNICRSPMAEGLFRQILKEKNKNITVTSAGLSALVGHRPDDIACRLMIKKGIDISDYRACQLNKEIIHKSDLILVMEATQKSAIETIELSAKGKVFRLGEWQGYDIPDPYQKGETEFVSALALIEEGVQSWIKKLG